MGTRVGTVGISVLCKCSVPAFHVRRCSLRSVFASYMATSSASKTEEMEEYFAMLEYVQSVAERQDLEEKLRRAAVKNESLKKENVCKLSEALKNETLQKAQAAYCKVIDEKKEDLENMNVNGNIDTLKPTLAEQNKKYVDDGCVAIRNVEPTDKETLNSSVRAVCGHYELLKQLPLAALFGAHMKIIPDVQRALEDLRRTEALKREITKTCEELEFLNSIKDICQDDTSDSLCLSALEELEGLDLL